MGKLGGLVDISGFAFGVASLPPELPFGPMSLGGPLLRLPASAWADQNPWIEFGPTVRHAADVQRLRRRIE